MILKTKRLLLRPWEIEDAENLYQYAKDDRIGPIAGWPVHTSVANSREIIQNVLSKPECYAICLKEDSQVIGSIGLLIGKKSRLDLLETEGEIGYWIGVPFWGQGLIPEAINAIVQHAFEDIQLDQLYCGYFDGNNQTKRAQEKCGFLFHQTNSNAFCPLLEERRIEHVTCLTRKQWEKNKAFHIREMKPEEYNLLEEFLYQAIFIPEWFKEEIPRNIIYDDPKIYAAIDSFGEKPDDYALVAEMDDTIVGVVWVGIRKEYGHIDDETPSFSISLLKEYRQQGIGTELMKCMLDFLKKKGYKKVSLGVNKENYAVKMYEKVGFKVVGDGADETEYLMLCTLHSRIDE